ncbi:MULTISPECIES: hypothetical protein [unclassified Streptosporangium]|uniref:hypothetical protein n=1 Tax=unclassified Streptosporangium TaxID=2632669 RepID=UPI002E2AC258|nr:MULTISPECIES: hypothetical protein [unclassified Streptosporangium]
MARHQLTAEDIYSKALPWRELSDEHRSEAMWLAVEFLRAGRRAGLYLPTATNPSGRPISLEDYEDFLRQETDQEHTERLPLLDAGEALMVATLLDELAAKCPGERLGQLAREMAVRLNDRRRT